MIEKILVTDDHYSNMTYFRLGKNFEGLLFQTKEGKAVKQQRGVNLTDIGVSIQMTDMNNNINNNIKNNNVSNRDSLFEKC